VHEVGTETALHGADHEEIREVLGHDPVEAVRTFRPGLGHRDSATALRHEAETVVGGGDIEPRGVDQQIDRVLDAVHDRTVLVDEIDTATIGVDEMDVRAIERRKVLVVEAGALAGGTRASARRRPGGRR